MSTQARPGRPAKRGVRGWLVPAGIIVIAGLLLVIVFLQLQSTEAASQAAPESANDSAGVEAELPDLTQFEYRDPADVQAAGPVDAPVALVVFSDYQCQFCAKWTESTLPEMMTFAEAGDLRIEWRDINMYGEASTRASLAAHAAGLQSKYWEYHSALYPEGNHRSEAKLSHEALVDIAIQLGLDPEKFVTDMDSPSVQATISTRAEEARRLGVTGTPSFLLNGQPLVGAQPTTVFVDAIENLLGETRDAQ